MKSPDEVQQGYIDRFNAAGGAFEQFDLLLNISAELDELPPERMLPEALVEGCQSQVWLWPRWECGEGRGFALEGDSDTLMVRGVIRIFQQMFSGCSASEILACPVRFLEETELVYVFDPQRQAGVAAIAGVIRGFASEALNAHGEEGRNKE
ncbi:MAG: SufE family protein [Coriobacteriales bacterium]